MKKQKASKKMKLNKFKISSIGNINQAIIIGGTDNNVDDGSIGTVTIIVGKDSKERDDNTDCIKRKG
jgi:hypothetical protein